MACPIAATTRASPTSRRRTAAAIAAPGAEGRPRDAITPACGFNFPAGKPVAVTALFLNAGTAAGQAGNAGGSWRVARLRGLAEAVVQRIAGAAHGADRVRHAAAVERLAQAADMDVDGALVDIDVAAPDLVEQLLAGKHPAGAFHQEFDQAEP